MDARHNHRVPCPSPTPAAVPSVSLVIPSSGDGEAVAEAVRNAVAVLPAVAADYEIIVVAHPPSDRATRGGWPECVRFAAAQPGSGYGTALRAGVGAARMELVIVADAGVPWDVSDLRYVIALATQHDVVAARVASGSRAVFSRVLWAGYRSAARVLLGAWARDPGHSLLALRREHLGRIEPRSDGEFASAEVVALARHARMSVETVRLAGRAPHALARTGLRRALADLPTAVADLIRFWWARTLFPGDEAIAQRKTAGFWTGLVLLAAVSAALLFPRLSYPFLEPDEGRYGEIAREMLASGNWMVPTVNHRPYYDKPPLFYWLVAASFRGFGATEWAARLVPACASLLTVLATYVFGTRLLGVRAAFLGSVAMALSLVFVLCGRLVILDSLLTAAVSIGLFAGFEAIRCGPFRWSWWIVASLASGVGVLTKGPVALVLLVPPLAAYGWLHRGAARITALRWLVHAALAASVSAPWYAALVAHDSAFAYHFFWKHNIQRYFAGAFHPKPFWFYAPVLAIGGFPWSLLVPRLLRFLFRVPHGTPTPRARELGFMVLWAGWCLLFFSLSRGKLPSYILPAAPALALVLGAYLGVLLAPRDNASPLGWVRFPDRGLVLACALGLAASALSYRFRAGSGAHVLGECSLWAAALAGSVACRQRGGGRATWLVYCTVACAVTLPLAQHVFPEWAARSTPAGAELVRLAQDPDTAVACCSTEWGSVRFYLGRDDMQSLRGMPSAELERFLAEHPRTLLILQPNADPDWFRIALPPGREITRQGRTGGARFAVVEARPPDTGVSRREGTGGGVAR